MKIKIRDSKDNKVIYTDEITTDHLIVSIYNGEPCILSKPYECGDDDYGFMVFCNKDEDNEIITIGNSYPFYGECDIQGVVEKVVNSDNKIAVFEQKDWKNALQWLINNCK